MKTCTKCRMLKHNEEFNKDRSKSQGLDSQCKLCKYGPKVETLKKDGKNKIKFFFD